MVEYFRRLCGYRFPPLGNTVFRMFFRLMPAEIDTELVPRIHAHLDLRDATHRGTYWQGNRFEWPTAAVLEKWSGSGATHFFDIGSNYGFFSFLLISRYPRLCVHAFEPNRNTFST